MFEKNMRFAYLVDFYGELLDENTRAIMMAYYDDDLSLAEIASSIGISRQGVRHTLKRGEEQLTTLEEKLGLAAKHGETVKLTRELSLIRQKISERFGSDSSDITDKLLELEKNLTSKGV